MWLGSPFVLVTCHSFDLSRHTIKQQTLTRYSSTSIVSAVHRNLRVRQTYSVKPKTQAPSMSSSSINTLRQADLTEHDYRTCDDHIGGATHMIADTDAVQIRGSGEDQTVTYSADETKHLEGFDDVDNSEVSDDVSSDHGSDDSWEGEPPPLELRYDALKHIADLFLPGSHGACVDITTLKRGTFHEARILLFEDGWSCIGRFTRNSEVELLQQAESALATMAYVRSHTSIPVPQVYFVNHNSNDVVGSAFVLMERMPGERLSDLWPDLTFEDKFNIIGQVADGLGQLAELKFDSVGCLRHDGRIGPLMSTTGEARILGDQPFTTTEEYMCAYINENDPNRSNAAKAFYSAIKDKLRAFLAGHGDNPTLNAPYRLIHGDFESQNILVERKEGNLRISGIIDWDWSHIGLLYHLCGYPDYIRDYDGEEEDFEVNKLLRKHFVSALAKHFPCGSADREQVKQCFREKNYAMNMFHRVFMYCTWAPDLEQGLVESYLNGLRGESPEYERRAYGGVLGWEPDSELESEAE